MALFVMGGFGSLLVALAHYESLGSLWLILVFKTTVSFLIYAIYNFPFLTLQYL